MSNISTRPPHGRVTLSDAMRLLGLHPQDKKRAWVKSQLQSYSPIPIASKHAIYLYDDAIALLHSLTHQDVGQTNHNQ